MFRQSFAFVFLLILLVSCKESAKKQSTGTDEKEVKLAYNKCGTGDTTLLFIHGWCINKEYWEPQVKFFCPRYTVVTIDLPGFGQSGKNRSDTTFEGYSADIKKLIQEQGLKNVILVGHSMSGDILLDADNKYPSLLAGIVGIDNLHEPVEPFSVQRNKENDAFFAVLSNRFDSAVKLFMADYLFQPSTDSSVRKRVMNDIYTSDSVVAISVLRNNIIISQKEKPLMRGLSHKLYLVNSDVNPIKADSLKKYCSKGFHVELVPGTGHYPMIEKPALFNAALQKVIDDMSVK